MIDFRTWRRPKPGPIWRALGGQLAWLLLAVALPSWLMAGGKHAQVGKICTWDVPTGEKYSFQYVPSEYKPVDFKARVYYASKDGSCAAVEPGRHPLVIVAHGRIIDNIPKNYLAMTYLTEHLASWGDLVVSVNLDVVAFLQTEATQWGIPHRGELILHAVEYMRAQNRDPQSPFYQRIDTTRIALVGHSRGGGAVIYAANLNQTLGNPPLSAIATLSPANFGTKPLSAPVPHLCLYGTWDGDLFNGQGPDIWARGTRQAPRQLVEIYGANHYFFTDKAQLQGDSAEIDRELHQLIAKSMVNAWLDRYLRGQDRYHWEEYLLGLRRVSRDLEYYISFQDHRYLPIQNQQVATSLKPSQGRRMQPELCDYCRVDLSLAPNFGAGEAVQATWDSRTDQLSFQFSSVNAREYGYLSFRASQVHGNSLNVIDRRKDFHVILTDVNGNSAKVRASAYLDGIQYPDLNPCLEPDDSCNRKQIMRGFRIPLKDFRRLDLSQVVGVRFAFDRPRKRGFDNLDGVIKVGDLEFSN